MAERLTTKNYFSRLKEVIHLHSQRRHQKPRVAERLPPRVNIHPLWFSVETPPMLRAYHKANPSEKWAEAEIPVESCLRFAEKIKITYQGDKTAEAQINSEVKESWLRRGQSYTLSATLQKTAEPELAGEASALKWRILNEKSADIGSINDNGELATSPADQDIQFKLEVTSSIDPRVHAELQLHMSK